MRRHHLVAAGIGLLLFAASASAAIMDARNPEPGKSGVWEVPLGHPNYLITLYVDPEPGDPNVIAMDVYLKMGDGSSSDPKIAGMDLIGPGTFGSRWASPIQGPFRNSPSPYSPQNVYGLAYDDTLGGAQILPGDVLAYITIDATGVAPGDYALSFQGVGDSMLLDPDFTEFTSMNYISGVVRITPEPSVVVMLSGLLGSGCVCLILRRRRKRAAE